MGVTLHVESIGEDGHAGRHPTWESGRYGGDRDLVDALIEDRAARTPPKGHGMYWDVALQPSETVLLRLEAGKHGERGRALAKIFREDPDRKWWFVASF